MREDQTVSPPSPDIDPVGALPEGSLTFVGAGPGNPELLTLAGANALRAADLVVLDAPEDEQFIPAVHPVRIPEVVVAGDDPVSQTITPALAGKDVVRLVRGDVFLDSDTGVLAAALRTPGLRVDVVPGVSCLSSVVSYAGVRADEWAFVTADEHVPLKLPPTEALVVRTSSDLLDAVVEASGRPEDEAVLVLTDAGMTSQSSELTTWAGLAGVDVDGPVCLLAGAPIGRRTELDWFESKPLFDWRVLVPVAKDQGGVLSARLASYGALPEEVPTMSIEPPRTEQQMEKAIRGLVDGRYKWIVFTSPNAVEGVRARFVEYGLDARAMSGIEVAAVGNSTAKALAAWGIAADLMPSGEQTTANLSAAFPLFDDMLDPINRVLVPRAEISTDALLAGLEVLGWEVEDVTAYRTVRAAPPPAETREAIKTGLFDAVTFASSSTVRNLIGIAGKPHTNMVVVAIGAATARTCDEFGLRVDAVASEPTARALADALAKFAAARRAAQVAAGEPVTKPSQRRRRRRARKAVVPAGSDIDVDLDDDEA